VKTMRWFVEKASSTPICSADISKLTTKQGAPVQESKPASFEFYWDQRVTEGRPTVIEMTLYACEDLEDKGAPTYVDDPGISEALIIDFPTSPKKPILMMNQYRSQEACRAEGRCIEYSGR